MTAWSRLRLARLRTVLGGHVEHGNVPGLVAIVSRRGEVHVDALGSLAAGGGAPIKRDSIFRITSMTKPVTAVAALMLLEEGRLRLDEPVDRLLPELADRRVLRQLDSPLDDTVPAVRPITLRDLLTFRMGFGVVMAPPDRYPIVREANELGVRTVGPPSPAIEHAPDEWLRRFATLPLMHQPGERWTYNTGSALLGVLIARAARQPLEQFMRERIFEPLGMADTGFSVPAEKLARFATCYRFDPDAGALQVFDPAEGGQWSRPQAFPDGAAGLVSTVDDFLAFATMLLQHGHLGRHRLLSRTSVEAMTCDHLTPEQKAASPFYPGFWDHRGWGFGVSVVTRRDGPTSTPGRYGWDGGYGTSWATDPREGLIGILMTQRMFSSPSPPDVCVDFWNATYAALGE